MHFDISRKVSRVLNVILLGLFLIFIRVWYLSIIQHDEHVEKSRKPQRRLSITKVERGSIRDRFGIPLAHNQIQYNVGIRYADLREIPTVRWQKESKGKPKKVYVRLNYIKELSKLLSEYLHVSADTIEDLIHGKAALFPHTPFIIKEAVSEELYYKLTLLQKDWLGIYTERGSIRKYPLGKVGCDVIGYLGSISAKEYSLIAQELHDLEQYLNERELGSLPVLPKGFNNPLEVRERYQQLKEKSYTIHDLVGKTGIESICDENLKGYVGKRFDEVDTKGNVIHELPFGKKAIAGQKVTLSLCAELQEFAEKLLTENEAIRGSSLSLEEPWIKGGAIVALDPKSGEILALASYPRFDPNDFIPSGDEKTRKEKQKRVRRWLENETYIGELWDGRRPLERERYDSLSQSFYEESLFVGLKEFLQAILPQKSPVLEALKELGTVGNAFSFQKELESFLRASSTKEMGALIDSLYCEHPHGISRFATPQQQQKDIQTQLQKSDRSFLDKVLLKIRPNDDKLLLIDLCRLLVNTDLFSEDLVKAFFSQSLYTYRKITQHVVCLEKELKAPIEDLFKAHDFSLWRKENFQAFLKQKRKEEKEKGLYARPYTDYLEGLERSFFTTFWQEYKHAILSFLVFPEKTLSLAYTQEILALEKHPLIQPLLERVREDLKTFPKEHIDAYLKTLRSFDDLSRPLVGRYKMLRHLKGSYQEKHLAAAFYPLSGFGTGRSYAFRQSTPLGSVFKLIVAYQAVLERYQKMKQDPASFLSLNPLTLIDDLKGPAQGFCKEGGKQILGYTLDGAPIHRYYKGGTIPRSSHAHIGKVDLLGALEKSSNIYFSILAAEHIENPLNLIDTCRLFGFGTLSGIELPGEFAGILPSDLSDNKSGLYALAIGQHSLVVTPLQTALMLGSLTTRGELLKPQIIQSISGSEPTYGYDNPFDQKTFAFQKALEAVGLTFPLFTEVDDKKTGEQTWVFSAEKNHSVPMPKEISELLIDGMYRVISGKQGTARPSIIRLLYANPEIRDHFFEVQDSLVGKTGTAEILFKQTLDAQTPATLHNHIWFGGISFHDPLSFKDPELVVAVYLRLSEAGGKEATPLATEIIHKWREIQKTRQEDL